ncbi:MAG: HTH domain-containing protein [Bacteroidales bacterium]
MNYITYSDRLNYLFELIKNERITSPKIVAVKFGCSEKTIRNMINHLRDKGYIIIYSKYNKKYFLRS